MIAFYYPFVVIQLIFDFLILFVVSISLDFTSLRATINYILKVRFVF